MPRSAFFSQGNSVAFLIADHIVFDDPSSVPVGGDHANLFRSGGCPLGSCLAKIKAADRNVIDPRFVRIEYGSSGADFGDFLVWINFVKVGPDGGCFCIALAVPCIGRSNGILCIGCCQRTEYFRKCLFFIE